MPIPPQLTPVFILGMHRSGTSATARIVDLLGVPLGDAAELKGPSSVNPAGFWEAPRLTSVNDSLLSALGADWTCPPALEPGWWKTDGLGELRERAQGALERVITGSRWAWKDPRTCVTFDFWAQQFQAAPVLVLTHRNPLEIALSLDQRSGLPLALSLGLWERYLRGALAAAARFPTFVIRHEELLSAPARPVRELAGFLQSHGFDELDPESEEIASFIDPALHRHVARADGLEGEPLWSQPMCRLAEALESCAGGHDRLTVDLGDETPWVGPLLSERRAAPLRAERDVAHAQEQGRIERAKTLNMRERLLASQQRNVELSERLDQLKDSRKRGRWR